MTNLTQTVYETILKYNMISENDEICVGLSGGADSVCLITVLSELKTKLAIQKLTACHINHMLRGADSEADEKFVRELCERLNIPLKVYRIDINDEAKKRKIGLEQCGRQVRYECFSECGTVIATAHNACDNAETVLLNLTRGSALEGLTGIPPVNEKNGIKIIRPLINCLRDEIEDYLKEKNEAFVTDKTNFEPVYNRNIIRLNVIPKLKEINPSFEQAVIRMNEIIGDDAKFLNDLAEKAMQTASLGELKFNTALLKNEPNPILSRISAKLLWSLNIDPTREKVGYIISSIKNAEKHSIGGGWYADASAKNTLVFYNDADFCDFEFPLNEGVLSLNKGKAVNISILDRKTFDNLGEKEENYLLYTLDYDKILSRAVVRNRRDGDTVKLHGRNFTQKLKKLFCEFVPIYERDEHVLIADSQGVIFVEGFGTSERTRVTKDTKRILCIKIGTEHE